MARNNLDMPTDSATAFERVTGEVPRTLMDLASADRQPARVVAMKPADTLFINKLKDFIHGNLDWLRMVNSERVRRDVSHKLAAAKNKRTTEFDIRINDMVSYRGAAVKVMDLLHTSKHGFSKANIRTVTHEGGSTDTVNYGDLTPLGDARPELMVPRALDMATGHLAFYEANGKIRASTIPDKEGANLTVHVNRQAAKQEHRVVPLYRIKGKVEPKENGPEANMVTEHINQSQVLATSPVEKFLIPKAALPALRSRGVIMSPILINDDITAQREAVDEHAFKDVQESSSLQRSEHVEHTLAAAMLTALDEIAIAAHAGKPNRDQCGDAQVFHITVINVLSGRDQIRHMRMLRGIASARVVPPFGAVSALLAEVYTVAIEHNIDVPQSFQGHGQNAHVWMHDLSQLTDIAMQINMRVGAREISRRMSPIRSVTPQGRARGVRPQTDSGRKGNALSAPTDHPHCVSVGCPGTATYNGEPGEHCCFTCRRGQPCAANYHRHPTKPVRGVCRAVRLRVARVHRLSMGNQGKLAAGHAREAHPALKTTIITPWCMDSRMGSGRNNNSMCCYRSRLACSSQHAWIHKAPCHSPLISLTKQVLMKATCISYMGLKYHGHRRMRNTMRMASHSQ